MPKANKTTIVKLARSITDGPRQVDQVTFEGDPGSVPLPMFRNGAGECEIDMLDVQRTIAGRTGLSEGAIRQLSCLDFYGIFFAMFTAIPPRPAKRG